MHIAEVRIGEGDEYGDTHELHLVQMLLAEVVTVMDTIDP